MDGNGETSIFHEMIWFVIQLKQPIRLAGGFNYFYFHPYFPGVSWSNLTSAYFSSGLVQPPTRRWLFGKAGAPQCWPQTPQSPVTQALGMLKKNVGKQIGWCGSFSGVPTRIICGMLGKASITLLKLQMVHLLESESFEEETIISQDDEGGGNSNMFYFNPETWGKMNQFWRAYFSKGFAQPPTRWSCESWKLFLLQVVKLRFLDWNSNFASQ